MYAELIIDQRLHRAKKAGMKFQRLSRDRSIEFAAHLETLIRDPKTRKLLPQGQLIRPLNREESDFLDSERLLCKVDFEYFFSRYFNLEIDPGVGRGSGIGPPILLESQKRYIKLFGKREIECHEEQRKHKFTTGIKAYIHKVRQVAATATVRGMVWHRMLFWYPVRGLFATLDDQRVSEVFARDHLFLDKLAWWLKPNVYPDKQNDELGFADPLSSRMSYQAENSETGFGTGTQNDVSHLTEVALFKQPGKIRFSFVPSIPKAITTLHVQESTSDGKGNYWHEASENSRCHRRGYEDFIYCFIPWWYNKAKYRAIAPDDWTPEEHTQRHADKIERTSPEFNDGVVYHPTREQLYWWESSRAEHVSNGELAEFLTNFGADPGETFQSPQRGALPPELIEQLSNECMNPGACYEYELSAN